MFQRWNIFFMQIKRLQKLCEKFLNEKYNGIIIQSFVPHRRFLFNETNGIWEESVIAIEIHMTMNTRHFLGDIWKDLELYFSYEFILNV